MSASGHGRRFRDVRDKSGLPPTPVRLRQRGEPTLRARFGNDVVEGKWLDVLAAY